MRIVVFGQLSPDTITTLRRTHDVACMPQPHSENEKSSLAKAEVLVTRGHVRITQEVLDQAPQLHLLVKAGSGVDTIDVAEVQRRGIRLITTPASTWSVAELTLLLMLAVARRMCQLENAIRRGEWDSKYRIVGHQLNGSTLGIVGFGNIGSAVGRLGAAFGMHVLVHDHAPDGPAKRTIAQQIGAAFVDLSTLLRTSDIVTLHLPLRSDTYHIIDSTSLAQMQRHSLLINTARAALVDKEALLTALSMHHIAGAGLDVFYDEPLPPDDPILALPQVVCTPHVGAQTVEAMAAIGDEVVSVINTFAGERPDNMASAHCD
ncbi:MAG TPA: NAD(P)-dependent oxidoreductase [Ktedonobacteraceae bacterium]